MALEHLIEGLDPTPLPCISKADILQMIRAAKPVTDEGWIHWSATAPNVVANPEMVTFLWGEVIGGVRTSNIYYYDGSSWQLIPLTILDGSITLSKISLASSTPYYIIQVNSAGNALVWTSVVNAIQDNTIPPIKLLVPNNTDIFILGANAGTKSFYTAAVFFALLTNVIPVTALVKAGADPLKKFLSTKADGSLIEWTALDIANIGAAGATGGYYLKRNVGNTAWEFAAPAGGTPITVTTLTNSGVYYSIPASAAVLTVAHGLSSKPVNTRVVAINTTPVDGYVAGDEIEISGLIADLSSDDTESAAFVVCTDGTNITVASTTYTQGIVYVAKTGGLTTFDISKWKFKIYLMSI